MHAINACFVSYRNTNDPRAHAYVKAFVEQLEGQLSWMLPNNPVYFAPRELNVGDAFNNELAFQLCRSACMVIFFSPLHFDVHHPYCALEYQAMLQLEEQRLGTQVADLRNRGLIFPIIFRGLESLPEEIKNSRNYENFDHIVMTSDFKRRDCQQRLKQLAEQIFQRFVALQNQGAFEKVDCYQFRLPDAVVVREWLIQVSRIRIVSMPGH
jgi:hypothetical protein